MTDLTDRMRTCAAHIVSMTGVKEGSDPDANQTLPSRLVADAADLLIEASNEIEGDIGEARRILHETTDRALGEPFPHTDAMAQAASEHSGIPSDHIPPTEVEAERMRRGLPPREKPPLGEWHDPQTLGDAVRKLARQETLPLPPDAPQHGRFEREHNPRACPKCDSRAGKRVHREGRKLMLTCPACLEEWEWNPKAEWV